MDNRHEDVLTLIRLLSYLPLYLRSYGVMLTRSFFFVFIGAPEDKKFWDSPQILKSIGLACLNIGMTRNIRLTISIGMLCSSVISVAKDVVPHVKLEVRLTLS